MNTHKNVSNEAQKIISEGWTDGMAIIWGTPSKSHSVYAGTICGDKSSFVDDSTIFDLASVSKIFFLICVMKFMEKGNLELEGFIGDYTKRFSHISGLKIYELMNFSRCLQTTQRVDKCLSRDEAIHTIEEIKCVDNPARYSDMGAIVLSLIIDELSETSLKEEMQQIWNTCAMDNTFWWNDIPSDAYNHLQSYDNEYAIANDALIPKSTPLGTVHDTKAQILKVSGHAGIFSTPKDISRFCSNILSRNIISQKSLDIISSGLYDYYIDNQHFGLLCYKKADEIIKSEVPYHLSDASFAMSGYTGTYLVIDPENNFYISINSNRIYNRIPTCQDGYVCGKKATKNYVYRKDEILKILTSLNPTDLVFILEDTY